MWSVVISRTLQSISASTGLKINYILLPSSVHDVEIHTKPLKLWFAIGCQEVCKQGERFH